MDMSELSFLVNAQQGAKEVYGVSVRQFWLLINRPDAPKSIPLGPRTTRWVRRELEEHAASLPRVKRDEPPQLTAARAAKAAGQAPAPAPFNGVMA
jgi:predicted DNA-binding transcriptional regulator AlpA